MTGSRQTGQLEEQAESSHLQAQTKGRKITNWKKEEASALKAHLIYFIQHGHKSRASPRSTTMGTFSLEPPQSPRLEVGVKGGRARPFIRWLG